MNICFLCKENQDSQIPILKCGCYCCNKCYTTLKQQHINNCLVCKKTLRRSGKKNKLQKQILALDILYSA
jgi:hypothetical protein